LTGPRLVRGFFVLGGGAAVNLTAGSRYQSALVAWLWRPQCSGSQPYCPVICHLAERRAGLASYPEWISQFIKDGESIIRTVALIAGGAWAYAKFVRGRVFRSRLEPSVSGDAIMGADHVTISISISVKNVGLSRVEIRQNGSGLRVSAAETKAPKEMVSAKWRHLGTFPILENHAWIEPGEAVGEDRLAILPKEKLTSILLELHVGSKELEWVATRIIVVKANAGANACCQRQPDQDGGANGTAAPAAAAAAEITATAAVAANA
jgi:hypothetical protein